MTLPLPALVSWSALHLVSSLFAAERLIAGSSYGVRGSRWAFTVAFGPDVAPVRRGVTTPGVTLLFVGLFYTGCVPPVVAERIISRDHRSLWAALLLVWSALWLVLVAAGQT